MYTLGSLPFPPSHILGNVETCCSWGQLQELSEALLTTSCRSSGCALVGVAAAWW